MTAYAIHAKGCRKLRRTKLIPAEREADLRETIRGQAGMCFVCGHALDISRAVLVCYQPRLVPR